MPPKSLEAYRSRGNGKGPNYHKDGGIIFYTEQNIKDVYPTDKGSGMKTINLNLTISDETFERFAPMLEMLARTLLDHNSYRLMRRVIGMGIKLEL